MLNRGSDLTWIENSMVDLGGGEDTSCSSPVVISYCLFFKEPPLFSLVLAHFAKLVEAFPRLTHFPLSSPSSSSIMFPRQWVIGPLFDIHCHVRRHYLPPRQELVSFLSNLMTKPFPAMQPPWQADFIEFPKQDDEDVTEEEEVEGEGKRCKITGEKCCLLIRIHQCLTDGPGFLRSLMALGDEIVIEKGKFKTRGDKIEKFDSDRQKSDGVRKWMPSVSTIWNTSKILLSPRKMTSLAYSTLKTGVKLAVKSPFHLFNALTFATSSKKCLYNTNVGGNSKALAWSDPITLFELKQLCLFFEASRNEILLTILTLALHDLLKKQSEKEIRTCIAISTRNNQDPILSNQLSYLPLSLPLYLASSPAKCLTEIKTRLSSLNKLSPYFSPVYHCISSHLPPAFFSTKIAQFVFNKFHVVLSHQAGPKKTLYFAGKPVSSFVPFFPQLPNNTGGLGMAVLSYDGKIQIGLVTDEKTISPSPTVLMQLFNEQFQSLLSMARESHQSK